MAQRDSNAMQSSAKRSNLLKRLTALGAAAVAAVAVAGVVLTAPGTLPPSGGADAATPALDKAESLAVEDEEGATPASQYSDAAFSQFADLIYIEDGQGQLLSLEDVPAESYTGFLFEVAEDAGAAGALSQALAGGLVSHVHGNTYAVDSLDTLAGLLSAQQIAYIEPDFRLHIIGDMDGKAASGEGASPDTMGEGAYLVPFGGTDANPTPDWPPSDQYYLSGKLWNLDMLNVASAWEAGLDGDPFVHNGTPLRDTNVKVAVIDTGMYGTGTNEPLHEDFDYDKVEVGYNFIHDTAEAAPDAKGHGTFVAGLIAAQPNNLGVVGAMPGVTIVAEKVFDTGSATTADVVSAIYHAVDNAGVDVINMSLGGEYNERTLETACDYAVSKGVLVVASAGNDHKKIELRLNDF